MILVHGLESEQATNRLYINQYSLIKGEIIKKDYISENKLEGGIISTQKHSRFILNYHFAYQIYSFLSSLRPELQAGSTAEG